MAYELDDQADGRHCVTAVFDNQADAETAKADLLASGFAAQDIEIKSAAARLATTAAQLDRAGFRRWQPLRVREFLPPAFSSFRKIRRPAGGRSEE